MSVGFTGTREGMTDLQKAAVKALLTMRKSVDRGCGCCSGTDTFGHGDCDGADSDFHDIVVEMGYEDAIRIYPPTNPEFRAYKFDEDHYSTRSPKPYLERNRDIVDDACYLGGVLIATPKTRPADGERVTGGTWYTVDYALQKKKTVIVVWPDGAVEVLGNAA